MCATLEDVLKKSSGGDVMLEQSIAPIAEIGIMAILAGNADGFSGNYSSAYESFALRKDDPTMRRQWAGHPSAWMLYETAWQCAAAQGWEV